MIKIIKLIVNNGKYINFGNTGIFEFKPEKHISLIAGVNGFGKSTLLRYLTFQPIDKDEFNIGGYVKKYIEYNDSTYIITQHNPAGKYSVVKDDVELNLGLTKNGYIACIDREFNIDINLEKVITMTKRFTGMSPAELKDIFSAISTVDYDYAFSIFKKATTNARDIKGIIKHLEDKITNMESYSKNELANLLEDEANYDKLIKEKVHSIKPTKHTVDMSQEILSVENRKNRLSTAVDYRPTTTIDSDIKVLKREREVLLSTIDNNKSMTREEKDELDRTLDSLSVEMNDYLKVLNGINITRDYESLFNANYTVLRDIERISSSVVDIDYDINEVFQSKTNLESQIPIISKEISDANSELKFMMNFKYNDKVVCPNCNTPIKMYDAEKESITTNKITELDNKYESITQKINSHKEVLDKNSNIEKSRETMLSMIRGMHETYYQWFINNSLSVANKISMLTSFISTLENYMHTYRKSKQIISKLSGAGDVNAYEKATNRVNEINKTINTLLSELADSKRLESNANELKTIDDKIEKLKEKQSEHLSNMENKRFNSGIESEINRLGKEVEEIKSKITTIKYNITRRDDTVKELELSKDKQRGYTILIDKLSPTKGLIAQSIDSFITEIVDRMNYYISKIFSYELKVVAPDIDDKGLTYKFGINVRGQIGKTVTKCSTGQKEAVNLAFILTLRDFSNNESYPLFLDEFGSALSVDNRASTLEFIQEINTGEFQTFMVSHYREMMIENAKTKIYNFDK